MKITKADERTPMCEGRGREQQERKEANTRGREQVAYGNVREEDLPTEGADRIHKRKHENNFPPE